jgi:copper chaperone CopZ
MRHITLFVACMTCRCCVGEVTARLRDVSGVETVTANFGDSRVRLTGRMELADVFAALTGTTREPAAEVQNAAERDDVGEVAPPSARPR